MCYNYITSFVFFFFFFFFSERLPGVLEIIEKKNGSFCFAGLATSKCDWCPPYRPCAYCCCGGLVVAKFYVYALHIPSSLRVFSINWYILHAGYNYSLAENVWVQYLVGSWDGPCWDCDTGPPFFHLTKLLVNLLHFVCLFVF
jgi:hypothetical protein